MMKLWKGLFYTFWMSDKPDVQEELAHSLSHMVGCFLDVIGQIFEFQTESLSLLFITCFYKTIVREWGGIDGLRMNKYLLLIRFMEHETFVFIDMVLLSIPLLIQRAWNPSILEYYEKLVQDVIFNSNYVGVFLQYCECFLEELFQTLPHISSYDFIVVFLVCSSL